MNRLFTALGLGSDTNSGFPNSIARRETLLKYTNRYFLPEGAQAHRRTLFRFDPKQKFSCYDVALGELPSKPSLGSPVTMMRELYDASRTCIESAVGPDALPTAWLSGPASAAKASAKMAEASE